MACQLSAGDGMMCILLELSLLIVLQIGDLGEFIWQLVGFEKYCRLIFKV